MNPDIKAHRALAEESRVTILGLLQQSSESLAIKDLSEATGLHVTTIRAHLDVLADAGLVLASVESRTSPGRPRILYRIADDASARPERDGYRLLSEVLASYIAGTAADPVAAAIQAGQVWGGYLIDPPLPYATTSAPVAVEKIRELMERLGFQPELDPAGQHLRLHRCPFLDVVPAHQEIVCSAHLGLIRGALAALNTTVSADSLEPFIEPTVCLARLSTSGD